MIVFQAVLGVREYDDGYKEVYSNTTITYAYTLYDKTVYCTRVTTAYTGENDTQVVGPCTWMNGEDKSSILSQAQAHRACWTMIYGDIAQGNQQLTVGWKPDKNSKALTTGFGITVIVPEEEDKS